VSVSVVSLQLITLLQVCLALIEQGQYYFAPSVGSVR